MDGYTKRIWTGLKTMVMKSIVRSSDFSEPGKQVKIDLINVGLIDTRVMQQNGFASNPVPGTDCIALSVNGNIEHQVVIATEKYGEIPVTLAVGDTVIYSIGTQGYIHLKADGDIDVMGTTTINVIAPVINLEGTVEIDGTPWTDHTHQAGTLTNGAGAVTGITGGLTP